MNTETDTPTGEPTNNAPDPGGNATSTTNPQATDTATDAGGAEGQGDGGKPPATAGEPGAPAGDGTQETPKPEGTGEQQPGTGEETAYADFDMPEGVVLEGERRDAVHALFRDVGLNQDQAQKLIAWAAADQVAAAANLEQALQAAVDTQREEWGRQSVARFGDRYQEEMSYARTAVNALKDPELETAFIELGWGNHPALVKAFATMGRIMRDSPMDGIGKGGAAQSDVPIQNRMYPNMT